MHDVAIVGAGPVGLMLACELKLAGVSVVVFDRLSEPDPTSKAGAINIPSTEAFYRRGMLPQLLEAQQRNIALLREHAQKRLAASPNKSAAKFAWHFSGITVDPEKFDATDPELAILGPARAGGLVPQPAIEAILNARAAELGVEVRRGVDVLDVDIDDDGVTLHLDGEQARASWVVGCDGGRSLLRKKAGFEFVGTEPETTGHQAYVEISDPEKLGMGWVRTERGMYTHGPHPGRILTVEFDTPLVDRHAPVTLEDLEASLRRVSGTDVTLTRVLSNPTRFSDHARQATTYRIGRVLLAGDAAHVHSPCGGQGLNLGIGDAMNLGWKLAATIQGWAPEGLLDTYTTERHPVGAWVLNWTRAQMALMRVDQASRALSALMTELIALPDVVTHLMKKVAGVWQGYAFEGDHPLIGRSAPDVTLADGRRLGGCCHDGRSLLLDFTTDGHAVARATRWQDRLTAIHTESAERGDVQAMLVRPDGHVAWATNVPTSTDGLDVALKTWLGEPI